MARKSYSETNIVTRLSRLITITCCLFAMVTSSSSTAMILKTAATFSASGAARSGSKSLRQRLLQEGAKSYGPLLLSDSPIVAEMLALVGYGHMVIDHEHSPTNVRSGQAMLQAIHAAAARTTTRSGSFPTEPIVRLPGHDTMYMKKVLDSLQLPGGVLVPMVEDATTAAAVVQAARYPKQIPTSMMLDFLSSSDKDDNDQKEQGGIRGCAAPFVRASGWGLTGAANGAVQDYMKQCEEDLLVMVQVETVKGVEQIPEIAAVPGVDAIFLGPLDLSCSIGKMGQFQDPQVKELIRAAESAVRKQQEKNNCLLAGFRSPGRDLNEMFHEAGYSLVCGTIDLGMLREAAKLDLQTAKDYLDTK